MKPAVEVVTPPAAEPVTAAELAGHLKLNTGTAEYADLEKFIRTARQLFEKLTGRAVLPTSFRQHLGTFTGPVDLLRGPVTEVTAVGYFDPDGAEQELTGWELDATTIPAVVYMPDGDYPTVSAKKRRPVWIEFTAGWATAGDVPELVRTAIKLQAGHYYANREEQTTDALKTIAAGFTTVCQLWDTGLMTGG
ncbi:Uncharacterized protein OS=Hoeflea sp. BAL378 GN=LL06_22265 PE=4 SV=1 [Gemmata massiliana]|uniref:Uncharacterized protein n=1 Tax=Gemmata massiliana TaxID=1210884 RepID=A0A6P2D2Y8_9BACT|nr:hypothetical protein [Gemmata massiliana]VTR95237.1 Uncharacterized protein OS=Hoeflea sp. BAL378 GN=LL06_22265 PE=4 SV=1 [Gemmata massiliana]